MSLTAAHIDALLATGATAEQLAALMKADLALRDQQVEAKRARDAERQRRHRSSRDVTVTDSDNEGQAVTPSPLGPPPKVSPDPFKKPPPISPQPAKRGTRLSDDFTAPEDWIEWAMAKRKWGRAEAEDEAECFVRFWQAKPGREACKLDWGKTWQNWVVNSRRQKAEPPPRWQGMPV